MRGQDVVVLLALGLVIWLLGTIHYARTGAVVLESTRMQ
jgi:hypothetical protein